MKFLIQRESSGGLCCVIIGKEGIFNMAHILYGIQYKNISHFYYGSVVY